MSKESKTEPKTTKKEVLTEERLTETNPPATVGEIAFWEQMYLNAYVAPYVPYAADKAAMKVADKSAKKVANMALRSRRKEFGSR